MLNEALVVLDASGGLVYSARLPRDAGIAGPAWSPDREKLAYLLADRLHIVDPVAGFDRALPVGGAARGFSLAWSPDGRWVAYGGAGGPVVVSVEARGRTYQLDQLGMAPAWQPVTQQKRLGGW